LRDARSALPLLLMIARIALVLAAITVLDVEARAEPDRAHTVYIDVLGKGGLWGLGYEWRHHPRLALGAVASLYQLAGDRYTTFSPYVAAYPILAGHHGWFLQVGPQVVHRATPSPGPEWAGMSSTGYAGELSTGYEHRSELVIRVYAMVSAGDRVVPWLGASIGWSP
jgi:hypothetical protein